MSSRTMLGPAALLVVLLAVGTWEEHFAWVGPVLTGRTAIGRTTIDVLVMNAPERVELRRLLIRAGLFPGGREKRGT